MGGIMNDCQDKHNKLFLWHSWTLESLKIKQLM